jgi:hypothetical protein
MPAPIFRGAFPVTLSEQTSYDKSGMINYTSVVAYQNGSQVTGVLGSATTVSGTTVCLSSIEIKIKDGIAEVSKTYQGGSSNAGSVNGSVNLSIYEVVATAQEEPIASHPAFTSSTGVFTSSIVDACGGGITEGSGASGGAIFNSDGGFVGFTKTATNNFTGVQSFLSPRVTYKRTYTQNSPPSSGFTDKLAYIFSNPYGDQPTLASGRNWMLTGLTWKGSGNSYEITEEYMASGSSGWNNAIYYTGN